MAKGQLHSTGTICKAEIRCPIEEEGGRHFDSVDQLADYTAADTGVDRDELKGILASGVSPAEAVSMARDGILGGATPSSVSKGAEAGADAVPLKPAQVKELEQFDPAIHSVFSNASARTEPNVAARALKKEISNGEWMGTLAEEYEDIVEENRDPDYREEDSARVLEYREKQKASEARQAAMAKEMLWIADADSSYASKLPKGAHSMLRGVQGYDHSGVSIGTVRKAPVAKK